MPLPIADYAMLGDCHTAALLGRDGSIDWACFPRFDSPSLFGALLGTEDHGRWLLAPKDPVLATSRRYEDSTFVLITRWMTETGEVEVTDFMPYGNRRADIIRRVRGIHGTVTMRQEVQLRFDYADTLPWIRQLREARPRQSTQRTLLAVAGPEAVIIRGPRLTSEDRRHVSEFTVAAGEVEDIVLTWFPSHRKVPPRVDVDKLLHQTARWWRTWASRAEDPGAYDSYVRRSLLVLRALTHQDTGGIVAAVTTSLPEDLGGVRNWDYRYVWLRDAALTLEALMIHGYEMEAAEWRRWLLRAIAGDPADVQIMYGLGGERRLAERSLTTLPGYRGSSPVRVGNDAFAQYQGDIFGEVMRALERAREIGVKENKFTWALQFELLKFIEEHWDRPDNGIWEIRGPERHFTHSRAMIWAAFDCGIRAIEQHGLPGPLERWSELRETLREEIESRGYNAELGGYTQYYGGSTVDASLLQLPQIGYLSPSDPRMLGTVALMEKQLMQDGLLLRYQTDTGVDGLPGDENPFLACSFWLVEQYARSGRMRDAERLMDRLVAFTNDVGLLSEEVIPSTGEHVGNTPQALSHLALVRAADAIAANRQQPGAAPEQLDTGTIHIIRDQPLDHGVTGG